MTINGEQLDWNLIERPETYNNSMDNFMSTLYYVEDIEQEISFKEYIEDELDKCSQEVIEEIGENSNYIADYLDERISIDWIKIIIILRNKLIYC